MRISSILIIGIFMCGLPAQAQKQRIGYIDFDKVLRAMPETTKAEAELTAYAQNLSTYIEEMIADYKQKYTYLEQNGQSLSPLVFQTKLSELQGLEKKYQDFQTAAQQDILIKNDALLQPIREKLNQVIQQVAIQGGYSEVINTSERPLLYSDGKNNLEPEVRRRLEIK